MWRNYRDIQDNAASLWDIAEYWASTVDSRAGVSTGLPLERFRDTGPGTFNDPDMLLTSTKGAVRKLSPTQSRAQFSTWAVLAAPLLIGGPVSSLSAWDLETYKNPEVIAVNQDPLARQGQALVYTKPGGTLAVWGRELSSGALAAVFADNNPWGSTVTCDAACWAKTHFKSGQKLAVRDLWSHGPPGDLNATVVVPAPYAIAFAKGNGEFRMFTFTPVN